MAPVNAGRHQSRTRCGAVPKKSSMIAGNADVPSALSAKREKRWLFSMLGTTRLGRYADETSAFPALPGLVLPKDGLFWQGRDAGHYTDPSESASLMHSEPSLTAERTPGLILFSIWISWTRRLLLPQ